MNKYTFPRIQLRTVKDLPEGEAFDRPSTAATIDATFKRAPEAKPTDNQQNGVFINPHRPRQAGAVTHPPLLPQIFARY